MLVYTIQDERDDMINSCMAAGLTREVCEGMIPDDDSGDSGVSGDDEEIFQAKCPDDKTKTNACAFKNQLVSGTTTNTEFLIFKKCGKGEKCDYERRHICIDKEGFKQRKNDKSCNYDNDCLSLKCISNKCTVKKEGETCYSSSGLYSCEAGLICHTYSDSSTERKCVKPVLTAGTKPEHTECGKGLEQDADQKCQKYGTIEDGKKTGDPLLCKSGLAHVSTDGYICDRIDTEPTCDERGVLTKGKWAKGDEIPLTDAGCKHATDYNGNKVHYYKYSKLQSKLYEEFLEDYDDLDLEDLNSKDKYAYADEFKDMLKWKTKKKYLLYENAPALQAAKLIDSDGKVESDKKCEYEFIMKNVLSSSNTKVGFLLLALFALLL